MSNKYDDMVAIIDGLMGRFVRPKKVIFNGPATIVYFEDGTKTVVKCQDMSYYDKDKGLAFALLKRFYGNKFNDIFKEFVWDNEDY